MRRSNSPDCEEDRGDKPGQNLVDCILGRCVTNVSVFESYVIPWISNVCVVSSSLSKTPCSISTWLEMKYRDCWEAALKTDRGCKRKQSSCPQVPMNFISSDSYSYSYNCRYTTHYIWDFRDTHISDNKEPEINDFFLI